MKEWVVKNLIMAAHFPESFKELEAVKLVRVYHKSLGVFVFGW